MLNPRTLFLCLLAGIVLGSTTAMAQVAAPAVRIVNPVYESQLVTLKGTVHPLANARNDRGAAPENMQMERMHLVLKRSASQEAALSQLIDEMHTPGSANYHKWLTPEQFGAQFGPSDEDIATIENWLEGHGFNVTKVNPGKQTIEFTGSVAQLRAAFHTQIHKYAVNGETHYANANDPQIPAALAPVVGGFVSLNNFRVKSYARVLGKVAYNPQTGQATPEWTIGPGSPAIDNNYLIAPQDFTVQYDLQPLYSAGINGAGQTIAIVNDSNINIYLVNQFRSLFGLTANPPQVIIDGNDPGVDGINNPDGPNYDSVEAYLDVEWSGAVAPGAAIDLVIAADTALENGLYLAAEHAVYGNVAPVIGLSFGECEANLGSTNQFLSNLWEQAAAQGITVVVSAGDSGSAGCDNDNTQDYAVNGQAVNGFASTPFNVAMGGTDFYYSDYATGGASIANYWNTTPSNNAPVVSIKSVIPEQPWNDSQYGLNILNYYTQSGNTATSMVAGGGGASNSAVCSNNNYNTSTGACNSTVSGYPKPSWQSGSGVPNDNARDLPDLSLFAADGQNDSYYPICAVDGDCQPVSSGGDVQFYGVGGTSSSAPSFAGIMALINQKYGPQGQANFVLYPLAAQYPAAFHDVTVGDNSVPCSYSPISPNCISTANPITVTDPTYGTATEGQIGTGTTTEYSAGPGFDLASGLGSVDANLLVTDWNKVSFSATTTTLAASSTSFTHGTAITLSGTVTTASGTPTGDVALMTDSADPVSQGQTFFALSNGSYSSSVNFLPGGTYNIWAQYGGDTANNMSASTKTQITVSPEASTTYFTILDAANPSQTGSSAINSGTTNIPYGTQLILSAEPYPTTYYNQCVIASNPPSSCNTLYYTYPTGTVTFADNGTAISTAVLNTEGDAEYNGPWSIGSHSVTASYSGDRSYNASIGAPTLPITFSISQNTPTLNLTSASQTLNNSGAATGGQANAFTIQVENSANLNNENTYSINYSNPATAPTGTVTVSGFPSGVPTTATLSAAIDSTTYSAEGVGIITAPAGTAAGTYTVTVNYPGDAHYSSASQSFTVQIAGASGLASTTAASMTGSISPSTSISVIGTVTGVSGHPAPTGSILLFSSGYSLGSVNITPGTSGDVSSFEAQLDSQNLIQGANLISIQYSGDTVYAPSSTTLTPISNPLSDFSLTPQSSIVAVPTNGSGTDTISLSSVNGFSGTVSLNCTAAAGITCSISPSVALASAGSGSATLTVNAASSTADGNYTVQITGTDATGAYVHTLGIEAAVGASTTTPTGFSLTPNPASLSFAPGATTGNTATISVTPSGGFTGAVSLSCSITTNASSDPATCSLSPTSVTISGATAQTSTLTITTTAATSSSLDRGRKLLWPSAGGAALALLLFLVPRRRRNWLAMLGLLVLSVSVAGLGCGGGSGGSSGSGNSGTTAGSYTVTVTGNYGAGSAVIKESTAVTFNVM
jgi:subtilase family serine protease